MAGKSAATRAKSNAELRKEDLINRVYRYYLGQGFSPVAAAYMVGSLLQESNLDPTAHQKPTGPGRGLAQWTDDPKHKSFKDLKEFAEKKGIAWDKITVQLMFTIQQRPKVTAQFKGASTEAQAKAAATAFENFDASQPGQRWAIAGQIIKNVAGGNSPGNNLGSYVTSDGVDGRIQDLENQFHLQDVYGVVTQCRANQQPAANDPPDHDEVVTGTILKK